MGLSPMSNYRKIQFFVLTLVPRSPGKWNWNRLSFLPFIFSFEQCVCTNQQPTLLNIIKIPLDNAKLSLLSQSRKQLSFSCKQEFPTVYARSSLAYLISVIIPLHKWFSTTVQYLSGCIEQEFMVKFHRFNRYITLKVDFQVGHYYH